MTKSLRSIVSLWRCLAWKKWKWWTYCS